MSNHLLTSQRAERRPQDLLSSLNSRSTSDIYALCYAFSTCWSRPSSPPPSRYALLPWRPSMRNGGTEKTGSEQTRVTAVVPPALSSEVEENTSVTSNTAFRCLQHCVGVLMNCWVSQTHPHKQRLATDRWGLMWSERSCWRGWISRRWTPGGTGPPPLRDRPPNTTAQQPNTLNTTLQLVNT